LGFKRLQNNQKNQASEKSILKIIGSASETDSKINCSFQEEQIEK